MFNSVKREGVTAPQSVAGSEVSEGSYTYQSSTPFVPNLRLFFTPFTEQASPPRAPSHESRPAAARRPPIVHRCPLPSRGPLPPLWLLPPPQFTSPAYGCRPAAGRRPTSVGCLPVARRWSVTSRRLVPPCARPSLTPLRHAATRPLLLRQSLAAAPLVSHCAWLGWLWCGGVRSRVQGGVCSCFILSRVCVIDGNRVCLCILIVLFKRRG